MLGWLGAFFTDPLLWLATIIGVVGFFVLGRLGNQLGATKIRGTEEQSSRWLVLLSLVALLPALIVYWLLAGQFLWMLPVVLVAMSVAAYLVNLALDAALNLNGEEAKRAAHVQKLASLSSVQSITIFILMFAVLIAGVVGWINAFSAYMGESPNRPFLIAFWLFSVPFGASAITQIAMAASVILNPAAGGRARRQTYARVWQVLVAIILIVGFPFYTFPDQAAQAFGITEDFVQLSRLGVIGVFVSATVMLMIGMVSHRHFRKDLLNKRMTFAVEARQVFGNDIRSPVQEAEFFQRVFREVGRLVRHRQFQQRYFAHLVAQRLPCPIDPITGHDIPGAFSQMQELVLIAACDELDRAQFVAGLTADAFGEVIEDNLIDIARWDSLSAYVRELFGYIEAELLGDTDDVILRHAEAAIENIEIQRGALKLDGDGLSPAGLTTGIITNVIATGVYSGMLQTLTP